MTEQRKTWTHSDPLESYLSDWPVLVKVNNDYQMLSPTVSSLTSQTAGNRCPHFSLGIPPLLRFYQTSLYHPLFVSSSILIKFSSNSANSFAQPQDVWEPKGQSWVFSSIYSPLQKWSVQYRLQMLPICLCIISLRLKSLTCLISLLRNQVPTWHPNLEVILPQI